MIMRAIYSYDFFMTTECFLKHYKFTSKLFLPLYIIINPFLLIYQEYNLKIKLV